VVRTSAKHCLHCRLNKGALEHPRPLGEALQATVRKEVLHTDFVFLQKHMYAPFTYLLALKDGFSGYIDLISDAPPVTIYCRLYAGPALALAFLEKREESTLGRSVGQ
jgi:hypothetical protein